MKKGIKLVTTILLGATLLGLTACGSVESEDTAKAEGRTEEKSDASGDLKPVRLGIPGSQDTFVLLENGNVALYEGYFEEELNAVGYTLEEKYFAGCGPEINEAMAAGEIDVAIYGDLPIFVTKANGIDTTVVASVNAKLQQGILVVDDSIKEPKDLEGKRVIVQAGTVVQNYWEKYVEANGVDTSKVEVINSADVGSLLMAGEADAFVSNTYSLFVYINQGLGHLLEGGAEIPYGYSTQLTTIKTDFLKENPDVAVAFNKALIRAYETVKENPQKLYDDSNTAQFSGELWKQVYSFDTSFEYLNPKFSDEELDYLAKFNDWLVENGMISNPVDVNSLVDQSYYEKAIAK